MRRACFLAASSWLALVSAVALVVSVVSDQVRFRFLAAIFAPFLRRSVTNAWHGNVIE
jgi:hypothetical protein